MNGRETAAAERALNRERTVHLVDVEAVRQALTGTLSALTELEQDAAITLCDLGGLSRELTAAGLGMSADLVQKKINRRRARVGYAYRNALAAGAREPAAHLIRVVRRRDVVAVAEILTELSQQGLYALAIVLADMAGAQEVPGD
jgi:hypothetical protein